MMGANEGDGAMLATHCTSEVDRVVCGTGRVDGAARGVRDDTGKGRDNGVTCGIGDGATRGVGKRGVVAWGTSDMVACGVKDGNERGTSTQVSFKRESRSKCGEESARGKHHHQRQHDNR